MLPPRDHEEAHEWLGLPDGLVISDGVQRSDRGIAPAVIDDQLAATSLKLAQVGIGRIQRAGEFVVRFLRVTVGLEAMKVPRAVFIHNVAEEVRPECVSDTLARRGARGPSAPTVAARDAADHVTRIERAF